MLIFDPKRETFSTFRMPYPMPFYTRGWMVALTTPMRVGRGADSG